MKIFFEGGISWYWEVIDGYNKFFLRRGFVKASGGENGIRIEFLKVEKGEEGCRKGSGLLRLLVFIFSGSVI